jgi:arsenate reductase-like glutaredoxin family protein
VSLNIYGLKKCSTCQKALAWLDDAGIAYDFSDVKGAPLDATQVAKWSKALGGWEKMINRAGYTWRGLPASETADLAEAKAIALAVKKPIAHPAAIDRISRWFGYCRVFRKNPGAAHPLTSGLVMQVGPPSPLRQIS